MLFDPVESRFATARVAGKFPDAIAVVDHIGTGSTERITLDFILGSDGDWIEEDLNCEEVSVLERFQAARQQLCEYSEEARVDISGNASIRQSILRRLAKAMTEYRQASARRIQLLVVKAIYRLEEIHLFAVFKPTLHLIAMLDLAAAISMDDISKLFDIARCKSQSDGADCCPQGTVKLSALLTSALFLALLRRMAADAERLAWTLPLSSVEHIATAGGDTCLYIPRA